MKSVAKTMLTQWKLKQVWVWLLSPLDSPWIAWEKKLHSATQLKRGALLPPCGQTRNMFFDQELLISAVALWPQGGSRALLSELQALFRSDPLALITIFVFPSVAVHSLWTLERQTDLKLTLVSLPMKYMKNKGCFNMEVFWITFILMYHFVKMR